jgi:hypothetical protein
MSWTWDSANDFLKGGRKKYERPLYDRGLRIWKVNRWDPDSDISIGWKWAGTSFVTYHKDGTQTISGVSVSNAWGGHYNPLRSQSARLTIWRYSGITVKQRNFNFYLIESDPVISPPKIQGCRTCKQSGLVDSWCSQLSCWDSVDGKCPTHPDAILFGHRGWHNVPCPHGNDMGHTVPKGQQCYSCGGTKKRDYGSKPQLIPWNGQPIRIRDGQIVKIIPTQSILERMMADVIEIIA